MSDLCHFCGETKPLTIDGKSGVGSIEVPSRICAECVWRCVDVLRAHHAPPPAPVRVKVIATPLGEKHGH